MQSRLFRLINFAFAPVRTWNEGWQMIVSLLLLVAPPAFSQAINTSRLGLRTALELSLIIAFAAIFVAALRLHRELDETRDGMPKLVCRGPSSHPNPIVGTSVEMAGSPPVAMVRKRLIGTPIFYHLSIVNEPSGSMDRKVAEKVAARVQIFHENGTPAANERLHRWEHSPSPAEVGKAADQMLPLDIPPSGIECKLDIAMKYDEEDVFYTPNNETALRNVPGWKEDEFKFPPGTYIAEIHLRGANVVSNLKCQIVNKGSGSRLEITPLGG